MSLAASDRNTPVIREFVNYCAARNLTEKTTRSMSIVHLTESKFKIGSWWDRFSPTEQYPNTFEDWMLDHLEEGLPNFNYSYFKNHIETIQKGNDDSAVLSMPLCDHTTKEALATTVNGEPCKNPEEAPPGDMRVNTDHAKRLYEANAKAIVEGEPLTATVAETNPFRVASSKSAAAKLLRAGDRPVVVGLDPLALHPSWKAGKGENLCSLQYLDKLKLHAKHIVKVYDTPEGSGAVSWKQYCSPKCKCRVLGIFFPQNTNKKKQKQNKNASPKKDLAPLLPSPHSSPALPADDPSYDSDEDVDDKLFESFEELEL
jgi:hypothetical protein